MRELEVVIARLRLRDEQLLIHLQQLPTGSADAAEARGKLATIVERLILLNAERDRLLSELKPAA
jgi:hypothetical protein